jgi:D-alanyl-D-alanine carboxypeptidase
MNIYKNIFKLFTVTGLLALLISGCHKKKVDPTKACSLSFADSSSAHPKAGLFQAVLDKYKKKGLPGITALIHDSSGTWAGAAGKADIKKGINMETCHVAKVASITKIFMGVLVMKLVEDGTLQLDSKITDWLPSKITDKIKNAGECTLRQLMNHQSGIYDIIEDNGFYLAVLNNPNKKWTQMELLEYVYNKPSAFITGQGPKYSNTNTLLVSMIIEKATGRSHADLLRERVIDPLQLNNTFYYWHDDLPAYTAQGYFDLYNNNQIQNLSNYSTGSGNGYTGLYSSVNDMKIFVEALLKNKTLLQPSSLAEMLTFEPKTGDDRLLGPGMMKDFINRPDPNEFAYGHRGRDLAYSADLFYFPNQDITFTLIVNYGTDANSSLRDTFYDFRNELVDAALQ